ncbi:MAG: PIN domain-containing protein [Candidatus Helarchaeota archaeon]
MARNCLDAGIISLYYQKDPPKRIFNLMEDVKKGKITTLIPSIILVEAFKHLCVAGGKDYAANCIRSFQYKCRPTLISLSPELIFTAGQLKCRYRSILSYNDAILIAVALKEKAILHTTEKNLPQIHNLHVIPYEF